MSEVKSTGGRDARVGLGVADEGVRNAGNRLKTRDSPPALFYSTSSRVKMNVFLVSI